MNASPPAGPDSQSAGVDAPGAQAPSSAALPLALSYAALIVYASLYPFEGWRDQGLAPWSFLWAAWPRYWTGFDFGINVVGYLPMGFLAALAVRRMGPAGAAWPAVTGGLLAGALLAGAMETLQGYLPARIPSNVDLGLNAAGALIGALLAVALERLGLLSGWSRARERWFVRDARGGLVLLVLWPVALLFPAAVPFGLGQVFERLESALAHWLTDTPFLDWLPLREFELQPLVPAAQMLCVALGLLVPVVLGYTLARSAGRRALLAALIALGGLAASGLSFALSWGPAHAWSWWSAPVVAGLLLAVLAAAALLRAPRRLCLVLLLLGLALHLSLLNRAPQNPYFALTLASWEQGRFIRFHGLIQWLGWLWPFAVLAYGAAALAAPAARPGRATGRRRSSERP